MAVSAIIIGVAFGWFLERGGMGSARTIAAQFYGRNLALLRLMVTAIVTAALGLFWLGRLGVVDPARIYVPDTFVLAQTIGGAVFGVGFVTAGLCPGTSCVAAASGHGDGVAVIAGMLGGVLVYHEGLAALRPLAETGALGPATLSSVFHLPYGVTVALVVVLGVAVLAVTERGTTRAPRLVAVAALAAAPTVLDVDVLARTIEREEDHVSPRELATWIRDGRPGLRVIDVRSDSEFAIGHIPLAEHMTLSVLRTARFRRDETVVLYSAGGAHAAQGWFFLRAAGLEHVYFLRGGMDEWMRVPRGAWREGC